MSKSNQNRSLPSYECITLAGEDRPWITMVHGASQHHGVFSEQVRRFAPDYRLLLIDLPGHGKSTAMPGPYGLAEYAESVLAAMNQAGVQNSYFWGTHTGAGVGLLLAHRYPDRFLSLVLEGAILPGIELPSVTENIGRAKSTARKMGVAAARTEWFEKAAWFDVIRNNPDQCRAKEHRSMIDEFAGGPWLDSSIMQTVPSMIDEVSQIVLPVLLVNGEHELADFMQAADTLARKLPNVERVIIQEAGGFPLWEFPDASAESVRDFLRKRDERD